MQNIRKDCDNSSFEACIIIPSLIKQSLNGYCSNKNYADEQTYISTIQYDEVALKRIEVIYCLKGNGLITKNESDHQIDKHEFVTYDYSINPKFSKESISTHPLELYKLMIKESK